MAVQPLSNSQAMKSGGDLRLSGLKRNYPPLIESSGQPLGTTPHGTKIGGKEYPKCPPEFAILRKKIRTSHYRLGVKIANSIHR